MRASAYEISNNQIMAENSLQGALPSLDVTVEKTDGETGIYDDTIIDVIIVDMIVILIISVKIITTIIDKIEKTDGETGIYDYHYY